MAELPSFKPSGQGASVDLNNIIKSQAISWGAYKGGLAKRMKKLNGVQNLEGHEVYKDIDITQGVQNSNSDIYEMLEFMGFKEEDLAELSSTITNKDYDIKSALLNYKGSNTYEKEDFENLLNEVLEYIYNMDYMTIRVRNHMYRPESTPVPSYGARDFRLTYGTYSEELELDDQYCDEINTGIPCDEGNAPYSLGRYISDGNYFTPDIPTASILNINKLLENFEIKMYKNGVDISSQYIPALKVFIAFLAIVEEEMVSVSNKIVENKKRSVTYQSYDDGDAIYRDVTEEWNEVIITETFTFDNILQETLKSDTKFNLYVTTCVDRKNCSSNATDEEKEAKIPSYNYPAYMWKATEILISDDTLNLTNGLFVKYKGEGILTYINGSIEYVYPDAQIFMTVDGLKKSTPGEFGYYVSIFMNIEFIQNKKSWLEKFVGGIMKAFLSFVDALIGIFLKIPILKQFTEIILNVIGKVFNVNEGTAREIFTQVLAAVLIIVISMHIGPLISNAISSLTTTGTAALGTGVNAYIAANASVGMSATFSTMATYSSQALSLYNAAQNGRAIGEAKQIATDRANREYRNKKAQEVSMKGEALLGGTMGGSSTYAAMNNGMYDMMFNPFYYFPQAIPPEELPNGYLF